MYADMEHWSEIRRRVLTGELSKRQACEQYQIHWKTLVKILRHEEPPGYRRLQPARRPTIEPVLPVIRQILDEDAKAANSLEELRDLRVNDFSKEGDGQQERPVPEENLDSTDGRQP